MKLTCNNCGNVGVIAASYMEEMKVYPLCEKCVKDGCVPDRYIVERFAVTNASELVAAAAPILAQVAQNTVDGDIPTSQAIEAQDWLNRVKKALA